MYVDENNRISFYKNQPNYEVKYESLFSFSKNNNLTIF